MGGDEAEDEERVFMNKSFNETRFMECLGFERQFFMLFSCFGWNFTAQSFFYLSQSGVRIFMRLELRRFWAAGAFPV